MFRKLLIANRGEIAVRVMRTCRELGVRTVAVYTDADRESLHVRMADEAHHLPGSTATETYLAADAVLGVAARAGADALHPGYGFLSEQAAFAAAVDAAGLTFVGPPASVIEKMGDKMSARRTAEAAGVAAVPGLTGGIHSAADVRAFAAEQGWPVAIKAAFGGGGRGLRVVDQGDDVDAAITAAAREATASFGHPDLYVERYLSWPRHVEVQILADGHGTIVSLGTRDCSVQRRHQKLVEESPAAGLDERLQELMSEAAVAVGKACGYVNGGTVEFLAQDGRFWFLEMNTRLQVEHPVTELTTGLDLVEWQLRVAAGERLALPERALAPHGHAIEVRINAEDPSHGRFLPSPGRLTALRLPSGPGVRVDSGYEVGDEVSPAFDNLIAKVVTWGVDRDAARRRMLRALAELEISGVRTTAPAHVAILSHPDFVEGRHSTRWLEERVELGELNGAPATTAPDDGRSAGEPVELTAELDGRRHRIKVWLPEAVAGLLAPRPTAAPSPRRAPLPRPAAPARSAAPASQRAAPVPVRPATRANPGEVVAPMQGAVVRILVAAGDAVEAGQELCILEAMKMETPVVAPGAGTVTAVLVGESDAVDQGAVMMRIDSAGE